MNSVVPRLTRHPAVIAALLLAVVMVACGGASTPRTTAPRTTAPGTTAPGTTAAVTAYAAQATPPRITKVLVIVVENHSLAQMKSGMPYTYALAKKYAYASNYTAIRHPSLPNYLAMVGGSTFGVADDKAPSSHRLRGTTVFDQALARHKTAKLYADSAPSTCALTPSGRYAVKHNPWAYFVDHRTACRKYDVPASVFGRDVDNGRLPNVGMLIPDLVHDAHDAPLSTADAWIKKYVQKIQSGVDWKSGRLAVVITADEDDRRSGNKVLTVVASRYQSHRVVTTALNHYSLTRLFGDVSGAPYLRAARSAHSMRKAFGINTPPHS